MPGPILEVLQGDTVQVVLHNALPEPVSVIFPGQDVVPRPVKDGAGKLVSFTDHAVPGGAFTYSFTARRPGTFRYESGTHPEKQVPMGLYGVLIVRPAGFDPADPATWSAYGPGTRSEYDVEQVLVLAEIDSRRHARIAAGRPHDASAYEPDWWTINGRAFPDTVGEGGSATQPLGARVTAAAGKRILLRCVNAGLQHHSLHFGGLVVRVVAEDGRPLRTPALDATYEKQTLRLAAGQTCDVIVVAAVPGEYHIYDRDLCHVINGDFFPGGMMARLDIVP